MTNEESQLIVLNLLYGQYVYVTTGFIHVVMLGLSHKQVAVDMTGSMETGYILLKTQEN